MSLTEGQGLEWADRFALWNARYVQKPVLAMGLPTPVLRTLFACSIRLTNWVPRKVQVTKVELAGVPTRKIVPAGAGAAQLLLLHGGGFVIGGPGAYLPMAAKLALASGATVWLPDYRLAPEHPYPAAPEDVFACYRALTAEGPVAVGGDSAGGCLSLGLLHQCAAEGIQAPAALALMSPATDLRPKAQKALHDGPSDAILAKRWARQSVIDYIGDADPSDPVLSPIAAPFASGPPTMVQLAEGEALEPQIQAGIEALKAAGAKIDVRRYHGTFHAFQIVKSPLSERALTEMGGFLKATLE